MGLSHNHLGPRILVKIKIYLLTRAELHFHSKNSKKILWNKLFYARLIALLMLTVPTWTTSKNIDKISWKIWKRKFTFCRIITAILPPRESRIVTIVISTFEITKTIGITIAVALIFSTWCWGSATARTMTSITSSQIRKDCCNMFYQISAFSVL